MYVGPGSGQGQLPRKMYRLRDFRKSSCRAEPAVPYVGARALALKGFAGVRCARSGDLFEFRRQRFDPVGNLQQPAFMCGADLRRGGGRRLSYGFELLQRRLLALDRRM